jgi:hypothetical protein
VAEGDGVAGERLRVEARPSSVSPVRRAGSYVVNVLAELFGLAAPFGWPRTDVVVIDMLTGRTLGPGMRRATPGPPCFPC